MVNSYDVGDRCWIKLHGRSKPVEGRVIGTFRIPSQTTDFYLIQVVEGVYAYLEVRDALLMSTTPDPRIPQISYHEQGVATLKPSSELN